MSSNNLRLSIVVCAYTMNRWNELCAAVQSLQQQSFAPYEIIVVVDHNPVLLERARTEIPGITLLGNSQARGLAGARNSGVAAARGDVIVFMDEDAEPSSNWLETLSSMYDDSDVLGVGGAIQPRWEGGRPGWFPEEFDWVVGCTYRGMPQQATPVRNLIGCNMSFRRTVFEQVGGFRNEIGRLGTLPMGCEETEFCIRVRAHARGASLIYEPSAFVWHNVPRPRSNWNYFSARCFAEGLSKAQVATLVGTGSALSSERQYTFRTLPSGILKNIAYAARHAEPNALLRAGAIVAGLVMTMAGYIKGKWLMRSPVTNRLGEQNAV